MTSRLNGALLTLLALSLGSACRGAGPTAGATPGQKVIVLGFDGMDYALTKRLIEEGRLPNFARLARTGGFSPLETSIPPQSPVAWSEFITGLDASGHGIFDFVHRDPTTMLPYLSTSRTEDAHRFLKFGRWQVPLDSGKVELLRRGTPFWETLKAHGVRSTIIRMPANFPPSGTADRELSGMGTPDVLGTYGIFALYTTQPDEYAEDPGGGRILPVDYVNNVVRAQLSGPRNPFLQEPEDVRIDFQVYVDPDEPLAKLVVGDEERLLRVGEWSDWVAFELSLVPTQAIAVQARFYLKQVRPAFELYVSPLNLDPMSPAMPISTPPSYAADLARAAGRFFTQGMPEDTKALKSGVFTPEQFLEQAHIAGNEVIRQWDHVLGEFQEGLLFYYLGNIDQVSHMMWRSMDPDHPAYSAEQDARFANVIPSLYEEADALVGRTLDRMGDQATLVVMSDHGFASWRRAFHLNAWLRENGYLRVRRSRREADPGGFANVDWGRTRAYALGLNGLYINLRDREVNGMVDPEDRARLMDELESKLLATIDPATGQPAVTRVYKADRDSRGPSAFEIGPDLVVGYAKGTRGSDESALGTVGRDILTDNTSAWSGDHCMDHTAVPGILLSSRALKHAAPSLRSLGSALLAEFGISETAAPVAGAAR
jgi:predicted AlkP superfamily phosphohydrolase/phosphomutase